MLAASPLTHSVSLWPSLWSSAPPCSDLYPPLCPFPPLHQSCPSSMDAFWTAGVTQEQRKLSLCKSKLSYMMNRTVWMRCLSFFCSTVSFTLSTLWSSLAHCRISLRHSWRLRSVLGSICLSGWLLHPSPGSSSFCEFIDAWYRRSRCSFYWFWIFNCASSHLIFLWWLHIKNKIVKQIWELSDPA